MTVTRFNPNLNGPIHLGHLYTAKVNETYAHDRDGKFVVRFDDTNPDAHLLPRSRLDAIKAGQRDDLEWLGIVVDMWQTQSDILPSIRNQFDWLPLEREDPPSQLPTFTRMLGTSWIPMYYTPRQTFDRVVMDYMIGITDIIRGEEFSVELSLYHHYCQQLNIPKPNFIFLPRLQSVHGDISKTVGGYTISEFRGKGYSPEEVMDLLGKASLYWPPNGWALHNLRPDPRIR